MKFWCASTKSFKQHKSTSKQPLESCDSLSASDSYATIPSMCLKKSDSGFSETASSVHSNANLEQILSIERTYYECLKQLIIKYSRPLRRYIPPNEIVDLFQNIEKIAAVSESIVRHCDRLVNTNHSVNIQVSGIYQSFIDIMIDSYSTYISGSRKAQEALKQYCHKIAYFLHISIDVVVRELTEFVLLPITHICGTYDLLESFIVDGAESMSPIDWNIINSLRSLWNQGKMSLRKLEDDVTVLESSQDVSIESDISSTMVFQRTGKQPWEKKQIEIMGTQLIFSGLSQDSGVCLSNVVHVEGDCLNAILCLIVAPPMSRFSRHSSTKMVRLYIQFEGKMDYFTWFERLSIAIKEAKDQNWTRKKEILI